MARSLEEALKVLQREVELCEEGIRIVRPEWVGREEMRWLNRILPEPWYVWRAHETVRWWDRRGDRHSRWQGRLALSNRELGLDLTYRDGESLDIAWSGELMGDIGSRYRLLQPSAFRPCRQETKERFQRAREMLLEVAEGLVDRDGLLMAIRNSDRRLLWGRKDTLTVDVWERSWRDYRYVSLSFSMNDWRKARGRWWSEENEYFYHLASMLFKGGELVLSDFTRNILTALDAPLREGKSLREYVVSRYMEVI